jgi:hypothetical protein
MAANTAPIFTATPDIQWADSMSAANTTKDLTGGTGYLAFTAGISGSFVQRMRFRTLGTNVASVARVWINNGQSTGSSINNTLWDELSLPATTVTEVAAQSNYELPLNFALPSNYRLYVTLGTAVAAGWDGIVIGGDY